ncbi:GNAT family N-acetyltransferase [Aureimonas sp. AU20]|uniref:GNAT family N-acetyltransferase n=1 Tax=Aureimonas sp. AU20 TaxID=1349819 RepID=UPI000722D80E|nr:GNAT family N-acetyltransferase [Aureimonas sp. AU20]ALN74867.1 hypothetical protein M673_19260 [Aureimonas sp. AU20]
MDKPVCEPRASLRPRARLHEGLESVRDLWLAFETQGACNAHQRYGWMALVVERLLSLERAEVLVVELDDEATGEPILLLPLARRRKAGLVEIVPLSAGVCDYTAPILARPVVYTPEEAFRIWQAIRAVLPRADRIRLDSIPHEIRPGLPNPLALLDFVEPSALSVSGVALAGPEETLLERTFRPSFVKQIRKTGRRLERMGEVAFMEAKTTAEVEEMMEALLRLRLDRFRKLGRFDILASLPYSDFYLEAARQGLAGGAARVLGLKLDGDWLSLLLVLRDRTVAHGILIAIDEERANNTAPGLFAITQAVLHACREGVTYFDFSVGAQGYKQSMGTEGRPLYRLEETHSLRGRAMALADRGLEELRARLKRQDALYARLRAARGKLRRLAHRLKRGVGSSGDEA